MTRKSFLFLTLCALCGAGITYWFSYPLVVWLSTLASHELILLVISAFSVATIITVLWPEAKPQPVKKGHISFSDWCLKGKDPALWVSQKEFKRRGELLKKQRNKRVTDIKLDDVFLDEFYQSTNDRLDK